MRENIVKNPIRENDIYQHFVCGFQFLIGFYGKEFGKDQWGGEWRNAAYRTDGFVSGVVPEPVDPHYLDIFYDMYNSLMKHSE